MQFWTLEPINDGYWWGLILSKRAAGFGQQRWWEVFRGNIPVPPEPAPFQIAEVRRRHEQGDVMYTDLLGISFSARMAALLSELGCTGFAPRPSLIYDARDRDLVCSDAKWTVFQRGAGEVDWDRGYDPARPRRGNIGLYFDHASWTGLDMFKPVRCPWVVVTDRVAQGILGAGMKGYSLERVEEHGRAMVEAGRAVEEAIRRHHGKRPPTPWPGES